jgi:hypothetical protein
LVFGVHGANKENNMLKIPENIMAIVDACFAADIAFDLAVTIDGLAYRITSVDVIKMYCGM